MSKIITHNQAAGWILKTAIPTIMMGLALEKYHQKSLLYIWIAYLSGMVIFVCVMGYELEEYPLPQGIQIPKIGYYRDENGKIFHLSYEEGPKISDGTRFSCPKKWRYTQFGLKVDTMDYYFPSPDSEKHSEVNMTYIQDQRSVEWTAKQGFYEVIQEKN